MTGLRHAKLCAFVFDTLRQNGEIRRHELFMMAVQRIELDYGPHGREMLRAVLDELAEEGSIAFTRLTVRPLLDERPIKPPVKTRRIFRSRPMMWHLKKHGRLKRREFLAWCRTNYLVEASWYGGHLFRISLVRLQVQGVLGFDKDEVWYVDEKRRRTPRGFMREKLEREGKLEEAIAKVRPKTVRPRILRLQEERSREREERRARRAADVTKTANDVTPPLDHAGSPSTDVTIRQKAVSSLAE
ncbi:hypothetical protein [Microvirga antarctica]|uniref:hypothetical protein n=1 Tax=Microvirga antarctica TaxID=2819233 RepID=UPI001B308913|nr:hypothetical protein [Microvirga antarctica]